MEGGGYEQKQRSPHQRLSWNRPWGGLSSVILIVLSTVSLQFQGQFISFILWGQFSEWWQLMTWLQTNHHVLNFSTCWGYSVYKTAHRIRLRILVTALVKSLSRVRLCDPMSCSLPGSSVCGMFQARILEWAAMFFSRGSSWPRDWTPVSLIAGRCFYHLSYQGSWRAKGPELYLMTKLLSGLVWLFSFVSTCSHFSD